MTSSKGESIISSNKAKSKRFTISNFPEEIVEHILVWLPVLSLLRLKCVCKSWYSLISSKHFIQAHLRISKEYNNFRNRRVLFIESDATEDNWQSDEVRSFLKHCSCLPLLTVPVSVAMDSGITMQGMYTGIVGVCNGLICILIGENCIYLCNPSTREIKKLPHLNRGSYFEFHIFMYGFGFDEANEDYKVVCVIREEYDVCLGEEDCVCIFETRHRFPVARIYSLKSDSWKQMEMPEEYGRGLKDTEGILVNQKLHWINDISLNKQEIVSFDLVNEIWGKMEIPNFYGEGSRCNMAFKFGGCLSLLSASPQEEGSELYVWVLNEYGNNQSWKELFRAPHLETMFGLFQGLVELDNGPNGAIVFLDPFHLSVYDLKGNSFAVVMRMLPDSRRRFFIESLVPLRDEVIVNSGL